MWQVLHVFACGSKLAWFLCDGTVGLHAYGSQRLPKCGYRQLLEHTAP